MDNYVIVEKLGSGAFGEVFHVRQRGNNRELVIKKFKDIFTRDMFEAEVEVLKTLDHANIVKYVGSFIDNFRPCIVMEYYSGGTLKDDIDACRVRCSPMTDRAVSLFRQLCSAVDYVHARNLMHRDIKPANIVLAGRGPLKLVDFGLAKIMESDEKYTSTHVGTPCYMAPEVTAGKRYDNKCDIWSMGCVLYEMTTLQYAFPGDKRKILSGIYDPVPTTVRSQLRDLIIATLKVEARDRPSAAQILTRF